MPMESVAGSETYRKVAVVEMSAFGTLLCFRAQNWPGNEIEERAHRPEPFEDLGIQPGSGGDIGRKGCEQDVAFEANQVGSRMIRGEPFWNAGQLVAQQIAKQSLDRAVGNQPAQFLVVTGDVPSDFEKRIGLRT